MAIYSANKRYLYVATPGTASTSLVDLLTEHAGGLQMPKADDLTLQTYRGIEIKHATIGELLRVRAISINKMRSLWRFCFVRNPLRWYYSEYLRHREWQKYMNDKDNWIHRDAKTVARIEASRGSLYDFITAAISINESTGDLFGKYTEGCCDVFRFEAMQASLYAILLRLNLLELMDRVPYINKTASADRDSDFLAMTTRAVEDLVYETHSITYLKYGYSIHAADHINEVKGDWLSPTLPRDFDRDRYLQINPDVGASGVDPVEHYLRYGVFELRQYK